MLVIDRVVLSALDKTEQVRELQRHHAVVFDQRAQAGREAPDVGHVGEDIVARHQVRPAVFAGYLAAGLSAKELDLGPDAPGPGRLGDVRGRLDAEYWDARRVQVLQKIAVVAGYLGDEAAGPQSQALGHRLRVALRVLDPRIGVR